MEAGAPLHWMPGPSPPPVAPCPASLHPSATTRRRETRSNLSGARWRGPLTVTGPLAGVVDGAHPPRPAPLADAHFHRALHPWLMANLAHPTRVSRSLHCAVRRWSRRVPAGGGRSRKRAWSAREDDKLRAAMAAAGSATRSHPKVRVRQAGDPPIHPSINHAALALSAIPSIASVIVLTPQSLVLTCKRYGLDHYACPCRCPTSRSPGRSQDGPLRSVGRGGWS